MPKIDITLRDDIVQALQPPPCEVLRVFPAEPAKLRLPGGFQLTGVANVTEKIPDDCSLVFSLYAQLGPIIGNFKCIFAVLSLLGPLIEIIDSVSKLKLPPADALEKFGKAAEEVLNCVVSFTTPAGLAQFIIDILDLILKILKCVIDALKSAISVFNGLSLDIITARQSGNSELTELLECAQENALNSANGALTAIEPIPAILDTISAAMQIAGADPISLPTIEKPDSIEKVEEVVGILEQVVDTITTVRNSIPV